MRILVIEPDSATAQTIEQTLKSGGFNVYTTDLGEEGVNLGKIYDYDLITCETRLPDLDGLDVVRVLRAGGIRTPIMILSGASEIDTKVRALGAGADDYLTKPFHRDELVARIQAVVRRSRGHAQSVIQTGEIRVNLDAQSVEVNNMPVHLTVKEYQMLELLSLRKGAMQTKEAFLNHLYGGMDEPELKIIDVFICKLRKKLREAGAAGHIETVWGRGYVLRDEPVGLIARGIEPKSPPKSPIDLAAGRVMIAIGDGMRSTRAIGERAGFALPTVWQYTQALIARGHVVNASQGKAGWYEPTEAGLAWLREHGWRPPVERAVAA